VFAFAELAEVYIRTQALEAANELLAAIVSATVAMAAQAPFVKFMSKKGMWSLPLLFPFGPTLMAALDFHPGNFYNLKK
jgi:hypothetical protein